MGSEQGYEIYFHFNQLRSQFGQRRRSRPGPGPDGATAAPSARTSRPLTRTERIPAAERVGFSNVAVSMIASGSKNTRSANTSRAPRHARSARALATQRNFALDHFEALLTLPGQVGVENAVDVTELRLELLALGGRGARNQRQSS